MILVTGANGLIGSQVCKLLLALNIPFKAMKRCDSDISLLLNNNVKWVEGDILDAVTFQEYLLGVEVVVHCAAVVSYHKEDEYLMYQVNVEGTRNVVDTCIEAGIKQFIHISSIAALGRKPERNTIDEDDNWSDSPMNSTYARTKYLSELEAWRGYHEGMGVCVINPSVVIASGDGKRSSSKLLQYIWDEKKFYTDGKLNYVDARDVANIVVEIYKRKIVGERFILNAGNISYKDVFEKIAKRFEKKPPSIKVGNNLLKFIYIMDQLKYFLTRIKPVVTKEMLKSSRSNSLYVNTKSKNFFNIDYKSIDETINWACSTFKQQKKDNFETNINYIE
ncbi:MAG: NAD-dependent epimerase/dehydratase family protein [Cyclobacteriaceae bacterium]|nr:NAD-dependent epimerase/dehydratase family protein [Cyclobacteriaceae bacterium]